MNPDVLNSYGIPESIRPLRGRVRAFMDEHVIPAERTMLEESNAGRRDTLKALQAQAKSEGLWVPHLPQDLGGHGLGIMGMCALFREMGRSLLGAKVFNCDAPDQGNMDVLLKTASPAMKERYLRPLVNAEISSAFCMTEPAPGAGADPSNLRTAAVRDGDDWIIDGHKWYSTGGGPASFLIVMARTSEDRRSGATLFLVDRHAEGVEHVRDIPVMAPDVLDHLEGEMKFHSVRVSADAVLGGVGMGFRLAQTRLVPARLTHCMRWLGLADRTMHLCRDYLNTRISFGRKLADHQMVQKTIAENVSRIHAGNLMTLHCAQILSEGGDERTARAYSSMCKNHVARALCQVLDDAIQLHGGLGYSDDMPFQRWYRHSRAARIADGPDEVHWMVVAREFLKGRLELMA
ncbi:MAG: acyl-CoA dehydrogenase family protein [Myxococcota bacterium]|nr:acyl-CoA dehydrogenase family protein [Myxococcota bacterium]